MPFFKELREQRPVLVMPELVLAARFADCDEILRRYDLFSAALLKPKEGSYFMAQDDTAVHWREKSIMKSILDFEELPSIRHYVGTKTAAILAAAGGKIDAVDGLSRAVPVGLVQDKFGFTHSDPQHLRDWSYWKRRRGPSAHRAGAGARERGAGGVYGRADRPARAGARGP